ncbi:hypothetical protein GQ457_08G035680 [Hibiscus cannabinus]
MRGDLVWNSRLTKIVDRQRSQGQSIGIPYGASTAKKTCHTKEKCWKLHGNPRTTNKSFSEKRDKNEHIWQNNL